jgi:hypothetical protein
MAVPKEHFGTVYLSKLDTWKSSVLVERNFFGGRRCPKRVANKRHWPFDIVASNCHKALGHSAYSVAGMAGGAGRRDLVNGAADIAHGVQRWRYRGVLQHNGQTAGRMVHAGSDVLHRLWHERRHVSSPMKTKRTYSKPLFSKLSSRIVFAVGHVADDLVQSDEMIAHVAEHVLLHRLWETHERARILSRTGAGLADQQGCRNRSK